MIRARSIGCEPLQAGARWGLDYVTVHAPSNVAEQAELTG